MNRLGKRSREINAELSVARGCWCNTVCTCSGAFSIYKSGNGLAGYMADTTSGRF